ncbi:Protein CBG01452 [Caenorhabditis briggsae]|uniref:Protein CBG01452 n=1 Tax=Caenorhabditis briggsae TaxID=6238 RepID=A8WQN1_CAEBR|nr:Protein CBG01452 [Caenorhabditis briggsae]CAP22789.2 Protein CBG01452 [Caenorhabditis briggsae]
MASEMKVGWFIMTIFESILVVHSFLCSLFFMYLIANTKTLHSYCRVCLVMVGFSMNLFASYGFSIFEYLNSGKYYSLTEESASVRSKTWEFIHEFGVCLQSLSMLLFSMDGQLILATLLMECSDYLGLFMSEVYSWTNTLLPAVVGASIFKVLSMIPIWTWLLLGLTEWEYGIANFLYNNILNAYVCIFPWVLVYRNESLRKQILSTKHVRVTPDIESAKPIKTLEGKVISMRQSQEEYFDALKDSWDV